MRVRPKLIAIILCAAVVPLSIYAVSTVRLHQRAYDVITEELYRRSAAGAAAAATGYLDGAVHTLTVLNGTIQWPELSQDEREGALVLVYKQLDDLVVAALLDEAGEGIGPVIRRDAHSSNEWQAHPEASLDVLRAFAAGLPFRQITAAGGAVVGSPLIVPGGSVPIVPVLVPVQGRQPGRPWVVAVAMSMRSICSAVVRVGGAGRDAIMVDAQGRVLCSGGRRSLGDPVEPELLEARSAPEHGLVGFVNGTGQRMLASVVGMPREWAMIIEQPDAMVRGPARAMMSQSLFWVAVSLLVALTAGGVLAQGITGRIEQLSASASELGQGKFGHRAQISGRDEIAGLAAAFNRMGGEIERREVEIRAWNQQLAQRVEERTRELKEAQAQLIQSQKIAAMSVLGAGIAHEINNPLTGVLGLSQVLLQRARTKPDAAAEVEMLASVEAQALRIRRIVQTMLSFAQNYAGEGFAPVRLHVLLDHTLELVQAQFAEAKLELVREYSPRNPEVMGNRAQLQQVVLALLSNSLKATSAGGRVTLATSMIDGELVRLSVVDNGKGIAPEHLEKIFDPFFTTKDDWRGEGLSLTVAYRIVEEHHGTIKASSQLGKGTTISITLPRARGGAHLV